MGLMTSTVPSDRPEPTLDDMLSTAEALLKTPVPIGELHGAVVYLNMWDRTLSIGDLVRSCSVDHPYLVGTKIREAALAAMGEH